MSNRNLTTIRQENAKWPKRKRLKYAPKLLSCHQTTLSPIRGNEQVLHPYNSTNQRKDLTFIGKRRKRYQLALLPHLIISAFTSPLTYRLDTQQSRREIAAAAYLGLPPKAQEEQMQAIPFPEWFQALGKEALADRLKPVIRDYDPLLPELLPPGTRRGDGAVDPRFHRLGCATCLPAKKEIFPEWKVKFLCPCVWQAGLGSEKPAGPMNDLPRVASAPFSGPPLIGQCDRRPAQKGVVAVRDRKLDKRLAGGERLCQ